MRNCDYDWDRFHAEAYVNHNYASPRLDDLWMTARLARFYEDLPNGIDIVDVGTGPNLITLLGAIGRGRSVVAWEYAASNIEWLRETIARREGLSSNWATFWSALNSAAPALYSDDNPLQTLRSVVELRQGSIFDLPERSWDAATMFFVAESITEDITEFDEACRRFARAVKPGGSIAAAFMEQSTGYATGDIRFPAVGVSIGEIAGAFGDEVDRITIIRVPDNGKPVRPGYDGMLFMTAKVSGGGHERSSDDIQIE